jgi:hypothetical protein
LLDAAQLAVVDQGEHLLVRRGFGLGEPVEQPKDLAALRKVAQREFTGHPGVGKHVAVLEQRDKVGVAGAQVVDPDRRVDENQLPARPVTEVAYSMLPAGTTHCARWPVSVEMRSKSAS